MATTAANLGIDALRRYWSNQCEPASAMPLPQDIEHTLLAGLRLNILEALRYLHNDRPTYDQFECWIRERGGDSLTDGAVDRLRCALAGATDRRETRRYGDLAPAPAARKQPQSRIPPACCAVHVAAPHPLCLCGNMAGLTDIAVRTTPRVALP